MKYKIVPGKRKSYSMMVSSNGELVVKVPLKYSTRIIEQFLRDKEKWIEVQINKVNKNIVNLPKFVNGERFPYLGEDYPLAIDRRFNKKIYFRQGFNTSYENISDIKRALIKFYKIKAKDLLDIKLMTWSNNLNIKYQKFRLSSARTRWGSCSSNGTISLNYKLIMMKTELIDYVIVHELCHVVQPNHSQKFWNIVKSHIPDYKIRRKLLKDQSSKYSFIN